MALLPIITAPDPVLKTKAKPVSNITGDLVTLLDNMLETMYHSRGIGLAANQVGVLDRVLVMDVEWRDDQRGTPLQMINPEVVWQCDALSVYNEGCLSFPGQFSDVKRPAEVKIKYLDIQGNEQLLEAEGLLATCIQHEIDHLDGVTFVDHISRLKRDMIMRRMVKAKKTGIYEED